MSFLMPKAPKPDPELVAAQKRQEERIAAQEERQQRILASQQRARRIGGQRMLLSMDRPDARLGIPASTLGA
jgi:hypothetical protein